MTVSAHLMSLFTLFALRLDACHAVGPLSQDSQASALDCGWKWGTSCASSHGFNCLLLEASVQPSFGVSLTLSCAPSAKSGVSQDGGV